MPIALLIAGEIVETEEMRPQWYEQDSIPYDKMWPDDEKWYPTMLEDKTFKAYYLFEGHDKILGEKFELTS